MKNLLAEGKKIQEELRRHRRVVHQFAEVGLELPKTTKYVMDELRRLGYTPKEICNSGVVATIGEPNQGKTFLLRADMDALPIREESTLDFRATNGHAHACGHDMHTAMLLGAAKLLKQREGELKGQVKLMFQPGEEIFEGAKAMINAGVLKDPDVDVAMMIHVFSGLPPKGGTVLIGKEGACMASVDFFKILVKGKGCHGAFPDTGVDPINVLAKIHTALQSINAREISYNETICLTVGQLHAGNTANVIPDQGFLEGSLRTFNHGTRKFVKDRLNEIAQGVAAAFRAKVEVNFLRGCDAMVNDLEVSEDIARYITELLGEEYVQARSNFFPLPGSEDFSLVAAAVPSVMVALSVGSPDEGYVYPPHHPKVEFDESYLYIGAAIYMACAVRWLKDH